jgi:hypothetical protein
MSPEILDLLAKFQPALSALVGFTGVIVTLVVNAALARRQVRDNRAHESKAVTRAIASELRFHELMLKGYVASIREGQPGQMMPPVTPTMDAYITKLGLIPSEQISYVSGAYFILKELHSNLIWIYSQDLPVTPKHHERAKGAMESALPVVQRAIAAIDPNPPPFRPLPGFEKLADGYL